MLPRYQFLKILFFTAFVFLQGKEALSQIDQPNRFEKEKKFGDTDFTFIPLETDGIALLRDKNKFKKGNQTWEVTLLDTVLHETDPIEFEVDTDYELAGYEHSAGNVYFLFSESDIRGNMSLVAISIKTKQIDYYEIKPELNFHLTHFCKVGEGFVFGGLVNKESAVLIYHAATNSVKVVPGFFQKDTELVDLRANQNQTFNTILIDRGSHTLRNIIFRTFDTAGNKILEDITPIDEDIILNTSISSTLEREDLIIIGAWGKINSRQASGFYALPVDPFTDQKIKRTNFGMLEHYLDYLKPKKAAKIKLKSADAFKEGKIPDFSDDVIPFKIVEHKDGFLLLAETYIPSSSSNQYPSNYPTNNNYQTFSPNGGYYPTNRIYSPYPTTYGNNVQNAEEIKTLESVVIAFDATGAVLWDYSLPLSNKKMLSLEQICDFAVIDRNIHFLYKNESELKIKTINLDDQEVAEVTEKIKLSHPADEIRSEDEKIGTVKHWFGKNFYVWGNHSVRNNSSVEDKTRDVFYINKVVVH